MDRHESIDMMDTAFRAAHVAVQRFIGEGAPRTTTSAEFATMHLVTRALADVGWAQNAAASRFPLQAYSLMRPAWEASQLCLLFANQPELADSWALGDYRKFTPAAVRKALGVESDNFYSFMSERSHPRFAGLQMTIFKAVEPADPDSQEALLHLNDVPIEVTPVYMTVAVPAIILARLAADAGRIGFADGDYTTRAFPGMLRDVARQLGVGWRAMDAGLRDAERADPEVRSPQAWGEYFSGILGDLADRVDGLSSA
jgi:hypothetical protein